MGSATASEFLSLRHFSSSDLYHGWIAIYSLMQKLYLQEFDAIVSQSTLSITEGKSNNSDNAFYHKPLDKVEVGNVGEVEVGKVEVDKVKVGEVGQSEVRKVGKFEIGKIGRVQVGMLGAAQLDNLDKPTSFNELGQHVGTGEEEIINSTTTRRVKLLPKEDDFPNFLPSTTQTKKLFAWADD